MTVLEASVFLNWFRDEYPGYTRSLSLDGKNVSFEFSDISGLNCTVSGGYDLSGLKRAVTTMFAVPE